LFVQLPGKGSAAAVQSFKVTAVHLINPVRLHNKSNDNIEVKMKQ
jgi:hypothetical protein